MRTGLQMALLAALAALLPFTAAAQGKNRGDGKRAQEHQQRQAQQRAQRQKPAGGAGQGQGQGLMARFDQLDTNKDGKLSAAEGAAVRWFTLADANKDNVVTRSEASAFSQTRGGAAGRPGQQAQRVPGAAGRPVGQAAAMQRPDRQTSGPGAMMLMAADTNKDGKMSHDEFKAWPRSETMPDLFLNADGNKDGFVTAEELQAEMAARRKAGFGAMQPQAPGQAGQPGPRPGQSKGPGWKQGMTSASLPLPPPSPQ